MSASENLKDLIARLPHEAQKHFDSLVDSDREPENPQAFMESALKRRLDNPPAARVAVYKLIESSEHAADALAVAIRLGGFAFATAADREAKANVWCGMLSLLSHYIRFNITDDLAVTAMLSQLIADLENISEGRSTSILQVSKAKGRPLASKQHEMMFAFGAAIIDLLVADNVAEISAAEQVVKHFRAREWPLPPSTRKSDARDSERFLNWRARVRSRRRSSHARQMYDHAKQLVGSSPPDQAIRLLVRALEMTGTKV